MADACGDCDVVVVAGEDFGGAAEDEQALSATPNTVSAAAAVAEPAGWMRRRHPIASFFTVFLFSA
jgi:hypothetical protein